MNHSNVFLAIPHGWQVIEGTQALMEAVRLRDLTLLTLLVIRNMSGPAQKEFLRTLHDQIAESHAHAQLAAWRLRNRDQLSSEEIWELKERRNVNESIAEQLGEIERTITMLVGDG